MAQLYRANWLTENQRANILIAINAMQEKAVFMGVADLPIFRHIDPSTDLALGVSSASRAAISVPHRRTSNFKLEGDFNNLMNSRNSIVVSNLNSSMIQDYKHDTRVVNEAFQVTPSYDSELKGGDRYLR